MASPRAKTPSPKDTAAAPSAISKQGPAHTRQFSELSRLLRARSFWVEGNTLSAERVRTNLQTGPARLSPDAFAVLSSEKIPSDRLGVALSDQAGLLGPHSFGFLNNVEGIAPLSAPLLERPKVGQVALVVPRRDALPELAPLLCARLLGVSWVISVGDGDPADVLQFLQQDPATQTVLIALGKGVRPASLLASLPGKPSVVLLPPEHRDLPLLRAVARRCQAKLTSDLEEWLALAALFDTGASAFVLPAARAAKHPEPKVVVVGAGADWVKKELAALGLPPPVRVDADEPAQLERALKQAASLVDWLIVCGAQEPLSLLSLPRGAIVLEPTERDRLRALLVMARALLEPRPPHVSFPGKPVRERLAQVLSELPPPLYVSGAMVQKETLGDHDVKRLLAAYGAPVSRQAPVGSTTAALRVAQKLGMPVWVVPGLPPHSDVLALREEEIRLGALCETQADLKRKTAFLLDRFEYVLLRESAQRGPLLRVRLTTERGLPDVLRIEPETLTQTQESEACLLPLFVDEAHEVAAFQTGANREAELASLLLQISACFVSQKVAGDLLVRTTPTPTVEHAAAILSRT